jgi:hypothetical protein
VNRTLVSFSVLLLLFITHIRYALLRRIEQKKTIKSDLCPDSQIQYNEDVDRNYKKLCIITEMQFYTSEREREELHIHSACNTVDCNYDSLLDFELQKRAANGRSIQDGNGVCDEQ